MRRRRADMAAQGVTAQLLSPWIELAPRGLPRRAAAAHLRHVNSALADLVHDCADTFHGLALVDASDPEAATATLVEAVDRHGLLGAELPARGVGPALHDIAWAPFWAAAAARGAIVLLHPYAAATPIAAAGIGDIVANPAQTAFVVAALILEGVLEAHPGLQLCLVHGGGALPGLLGRLDALARLREDWQERPLAPSALARRLWFDSLTHSSAALEHLASTVGSERIVLGTDHPFPTGDAAAVSRVLGATALAPEAHAQILGANAFRMIAEVHPLT